MGNKSFVIFCILAFTAISTGCKTEKRPINYGTDACEHCKMIAMDPRFGAEFITSKGKIYIFDDINCLMTTLNNLPSDKNDVAEIYVIDFANPHELINAVNGYYVQSDMIKSPMASGVAAFSSPDSRYEHQQKWQGVEMNWNDVKVKFR